MSFKTQNIFTSNEVAKICKVAPRTVAKWFDSGRLRGYRVPGSQDRRIPREYLIRFLKENAITQPLEELEAEDLSKIHNLEGAVTITVHPDSIIARLEGDVWSCVRARAKEGVFGHGITPDAAFNDLRHKEKS